MRLAALVVGGALAGVSVWTTPPPVLCPLSWVLCTVGLLALPLRRRLRLDSARWADCSSTAR